MAYSLSEWFCFGNAKIDLCAKKRGWFTRVCVCVRYGLSMCSKSRSKCHVQWNRNQLWYFDDYRSSPAELVAHGKQSNRGVRWDFRTTNYPVESASPPDFEITWTFRPTPPVTCSKNGACIPFARKVHRATWKSCNVCRETWTNDDWKS